MPKGVPHRGRLLCFAGSSDVRFDYCCCYFAVAGAYWFETFTTSSTLLYRLRFRASACRYLLIL